MEGVFRVKVTEYDPFTHSFVVDSTGLDVLPNRPNNPFFSQEVDLNKQFHNKQLKHIPESEVITLMTTPEGYPVSTRSSLHAFNDNILRKSIEFRNHFGGRFYKYDVIEYNRNEYTHLLRNAAGVLRVDLNLAVRQGNLRGGLPEHVLTHLRAHQQSRRKPRGRCRSAVRQTTQIPV